MTYIQHYDAPLGRILLAADEVGLTGLWFDGAKYFADGLPAEHTERETPVLSEARRWLDVYFSGREPDHLPPLRYDSTPFRRQVCEIMLTIPYGKTMTYGQIAARVPTGNSVTIMIPGQDWCKVTWNGYTGYMLTYFLQQ